MFINIDDVATGALVNAIAVVGRRISTVVENWRGRGQLEDIYTARWFETYRLTNHLPGLPELEQVSAERIANVLGGFEIQAALQELLAIRLSDAPELDASRARDVLAQTITTTDPGSAIFSRALAEYYDEQIRGLVARLESDDNKLLGQIRLEAFATRLICIVGAIERHAAAMAARPNQRTEASFLSNYRRHVLAHHGKLEPPDFDRRRRVPLDEIYVPTTITEHKTREISFSSRSTPPLIDIWQLATLLDRSVLLGDPGGGKTTAATVLMNHFANEGSMVVPFLVTLRHYAAKDPPDHSIAEHIEHTLNTLYQCPPPPGMINLLLLTGRALLIFDGLDELLDTTRRAEVTTRLEHFCEEYPLTRVLVTSRIVGYDQASLDPRTFNTYTLSGFADQQVAEYAHKWFAQDSEAAASDADTFLAESATVSDLRCNPLMLALLCILYRGGGSLPRNRAEVYEQCASLLFRKWDTRRKIYQELRAGHLLEPTLRHLAWWLFTRDTAQTAVSERELITETKSFLHGRGFESEYDAHAAAREFVEFCRGRMWVFTDAGTTADGEKLYAFTHRTFLEYFAAADLAYSCDTPELLAHLLASNLKYHGLSLVGELAMQIKDHTSSDGAPRIYRGIMASSAKQVVEVQCDILRFLVRCLRSVDPSPQIVRQLTRTLVARAVTLSHVGSWRDAVRELITGCGPYRETVADEVADVIAKTVEAGDPTLARNAMLLGASLPDGAVGADDDMAASWQRDADRIIGSHRAALVAAALSDQYIRRAALAQGFIDTVQALEMPGGLSSLFEEHAGYFRNQARWGPYIEQALHDLVADCPLAPDSAAIKDLEAIGEHLRVKRDLPWVRRPSPSLIMSIQDADADRQSSASSGLSGAAYLGAISMIAIVAESREQGYRWTRPQFGPFSELYPYLARRHYPMNSADDLPELPVPKELQEIFKAWTRGAVNLTFQE